MNIWDILIILLIGAAVFFALRKMRRNRKAGCSSCGCSFGCGCEECRARGVPPVRDPLGAVKKERVKKA